MRAEQIEIYSDATNAAIMRHPGRRFPGLLIQGDTLFSLYQLSTRGSSHPEDLNELQDRLRGLLEHYKEVLAAHDIELPFYEGH